MSMRCKAYGIAGCDETARCEGVEGDWGQCDGGSGSKCGCEGVECDE